MLYNRGYGSIEFRSVEDLLLALPALLVDRVDEGHGLGIGAGEVPGEAVARGADAELAFRQVDRLDAARLADRLGNHLDRQIGRAHV